MKCANDRFFLLYMTLFLLFCNSKLLGQSIRHFPINDPDDEYFQELGYSDFYLNFIFDGIYFQHGSVYETTSPSTTNQIKYQLGYLTDQGYLTDHFHPFADANGTFTVTNFPSGFNFAIRMYVEEGSTLIGEGFITKGSWKGSWYEGDGTATFRLSDIYNRSSYPGGIHNDVTLINIDASHTNSNFYLNLNLLAPIINKTLTDAPNSFDFSEVDFATISITPENATYGDYITVEAVPNEGIIFKEWQGSPVFSSEDIDGDGRLDLGTEDLDGDGNFDATSEDLNNDGNQDLGEDRNGNRILDFGEDLDGDGYLDLSEDLDGNGELNFGDFDFDRDGNFDLLYENFDNDGNFDVTSEDLDNDGNFDFINEDSNNNGILDSTNINDNPIFIQFAGEFELNAKFIVDNSDPDNDTLPTWLEVFSVGTSPASYDTNNDGVGDYFIYNNNLPPTFNYSSLLNQLSSNDHFLSAYSLYTDMDMSSISEDSRLQGNVDILNNPNFYDLYRLTEIQDLRPSSTMIEVSGNQATVQLQMEESSDLQSWEDTGDPATMTIPADTDTKFFRFKMAD